MLNSEKPLWALSQDEFLELQKRVFQSLMKEIIADELNAAKEAAIPKSDTMNVDDLAELTGYSRTTIYGKVCRRQMPRLSSGRPLIFSRKEITLWLKNGKPTVAEMALMRRNGEIL